MINILDLDASVKFEITSDDNILEASYEFSVPKNELYFEVDDNSDLVSFINVNTNKILVSGLIDNIRVDGSNTTKATIIEDLSPILNKVSGGGTGVVTSVNGKTGDVIIDADDIDSYTQDEVDDFIDQIKEDFGSGTNGYYQLAYDGELQDGKIRARNSGSDRYVVIEKGALRDVDRLLEVEGKMIAHKGHFGTASSDKYALDVADIEYVDSMGNTVSTEGARIQKRLRIRDDRNDANRPALQVRGVIDIDDFNRGNQNSQMNRIKNTAGNTLIKASNTIEITAGQQTYTAGQQTVGDLSVKVMGGLDNKGQLRTGTHLSNSTSNQSLIVENGYIKNDVGGQYQFETKPEAQWTYNTLQIGNSNNNSNGIYSTKLEGGLDNKGAMVVGDKFSDDGTHNSFTVKNGRAQFNNRVILKDNLEFQTISDAEYWIDPSLASKILRNGETITEIVPKWQNASVTDWGMNFPNWLSYKGVEVLTKLDLNDIDTEFTNYIPKGDITSTSRILSTVQGNTRASASFKLDVDTIYYNAGNRVTNATQIDFPMASSSLGAGMMSGADKTKIDALDTTYVKLTSPTTQVIDSIIALKNGKKLLLERPNGVQENAISLGVYGTYEQEEIGSEADPTCLNHNAKATDGTVVGKNIIVNYKDVDGTNKADLIAYLSDIKTPIISEIDLSSQIDGVLDTFNMGVNLTNLTLFYNGLRQKRSDWSVSGSNITLTFVPEIGTELIIEYITTI